MPLHFLTTAVPPPFPLLTIATQSPCLYKTAVSPVPFQILTIVSLTPYPHYLTAAYHDLTTASLTRLPSPYPYWANFDFENVDLEQ